MCVNPIAAEMNTKEKGFGRVVLVQIERKLANILTYNDCWMKVISTWTLPKGGKFVLPFDRSVGRTEWA